MGQIWRFPLQIRNLLQKLVQMIYTSSHLEEVTWPSSQHPGSFWILQRIQNRYQHFVSRFRISSKNGSRYKLNHPKWRRSPNPLPISITDSSILKAMAKILNFPFWIWNLLKIWVQMQVEPFKSEKVILPTPGTPITILGIAGHTGQIRHFHLQIHDPLEKWVQKQVERFKLEVVKFSNHQVSVSISCFTA